jgi:hypothetical protein
LDAHGSDATSFQVLQPICGELTAIALFSAAAAPPPLPALRPTDAATDAAAMARRDRVAGRDRGRIDPPSGKERSAGIFAAAPRCAAVPADATRRWSLTIFHTSYHVNA